MQLAIVLFDQFTTLDAVGPPALVDAMRGNLRAVTSGHG